MAGAKRLPKPFSRPSIDLSKAKRAWQNAEARLLSVGDIVPDRGEVVKVTVSENVAIEFFSGNVEFYKPAEEVWAFTSAS